MLNGLWGLVSASPLKRPPAAATFSCCNRREGAACRGSRKAGSDRGAQSCSASSTSIASPAPPSLQRAESAYAADVVTAANRTDLMGSSVSRNAGSCKRRAAPREGAADASDAGAKQSRFRRRRHRRVLLLADRGSHDDRAGAAYTRRHECRSRHCRRRPSRISPISGPSASRAVVRRALGICDALPTGVGRSERPSRMSGGRSPLRQPP
jgi:hypothetical protein